MLIIGELFFYIVSITIDKNSKKNLTNIEIIKHLEVPDLISGSSRYLPTQNSLRKENSYINEHGLIKTIFSLDKIKTSVINGKSFSFDNFEVRSSEMLLAKNGKFKIDSSHDSNKFHSLRFSQTPDGIHNGGIEYTNGIVKNKSGNVSEIFLSDSTPDDLYYYCSEHKNMGGKVNKDLSIESRNDKFKGILISGNSVALGWPMTVNGNYELSFVNQLEKKLRQKDDLIDIVNLSNNGFNSWQENTQLARYLNIVNTKKNLPKNINLIASLGGIQDFWGFIDLLHSKFRDNAFYTSNGLMSFRLKGNQEGADIYMEKVTKALDGNIQTSSEIFLNSFIKTVRQKSKLYHYLSVLKSKLIFRSITNETIENLTPTYNSLSEIVEAKIGIPFEEYILVRDLVVNSVSRNIRSMSSMNPERKLLFVYLPTRFGFTNDPKNIEERFRYSNLTVKDLGILEKDYRESLINNLQLIKGVKAINIANIAKDSWFIDESHYSEEGQTQIANKLFKIFDDVLN